MSFIIPDDLADLFSNPQAYGGITSRVELYQLADQPNNIAPQQISYIRIPRAELSDFRNSTLEFSATCSATGGTYCRFMQPIAGIINRVRVLANSTLLDDELEFGRAYAMKLMSQDNTEWTGGSLSITDGVASQAIRNGYGPNGSIVYQINLAYISDILGHVLPIGWLGSNQINLEIYWANPVYVIETDGTVPTFVINNLQYHYANLNVTDNYKRMLNEKFKTGVSFAFRSYDNYIASLGTASAGTVSITLPFKKRKAIAMLLGAVPTGTLTTTTTNDKFITFSNYSVFNSSRYYINSIYIPSDRIQSVYEQFLQTCDALDIPYKNNSYIANNWLSGNAFICGQTLCQSPRNVTEDNKVIQGLDVSTGNSNIVSQITFSAPTAVAETLFYFMEYYAICSIDSQGIISVSE
jgi:hypothetical protein